MSRVTSMSTMTLCARFFVFPLLIIFALCKDLAFAQTRAAGVYYLWNRGPVREIGLAGASVALESSPAAVVGNPGLIALQKNVFNGTFDFGSPKDTSLDFANAKTTTNRYLIFGFSSLVANKVGFGFGASQVRFLSDSKLNSFEGFSDSLLELNFPVAFRVSEGLGLGLGYVRIVARRQTDHIVEQEEISSTDDESANAFRFGVSWEMGKRFHFGFMHRTNALLKNSKQLPESAIKNSYVPSVTQIGLMHRTWDGGKNKDLPMEMRTNFQLDAVVFDNAPAELFYAPGIAYGEVEKFQLSRVTKYIPRLSLELVVLRTQVSELMTQFGMYAEPPFLLGGLPRAHVTGGLTFKIWYLSFNLATDVAQNYVNQNLGFGLANLEF